jgi:hypothetical protein
MERAGDVNGVEFLKKNSGRNFCHNGTGLLWLLLAASGLLSGCCTSRKCQLEKVAKDWCLTLRASQIIPVYPLSEDLQPGDVFLVQVPIDRQQKVYEQRGFLPLDNHIARIDPAGYEIFYDRSFILTSSVPLLPRDWMRPTNAAAWQPAPHVAFPTYSFSVRRGAGLNLAVPVQGVPVGLSLLGSDAADGSVSIKQAQTLGVDTLSLYRQLQEWAQDNADFLQYFGSAPGDSRKNYLRMVTRVFATREMDVSLRSTSSQSAGLDAGVPKPVDLLFPELPNATNRMSDTVERNFTNGWETLQRIVSEGARTARDASGNFLPGGSLKLTGASARTVSLKEEFDPPLILGYLGFDAVIYPGGLLGPPIPTHAILKPDYDFKHDLDQEPHSAVYSEAALRNIYQTLSRAPAGSPAAKAAATLDDLTRFIPGTFVAYDVSNNSPPSITATHLTKTDLLGEHPSYLSYVAYRTRLAQSIRALEFSLQFNSFKLVDQGREQEVKAGSDLFRQLETRHQEYLRQRESVGQNSAVRRAAVAAAVQYLEFLSQ